MHAFWCGVSQSRDVRRTRQLAELNSHLPRVSPLSPPLILNLFYSHLSAHSFGFKYFCSFLHSVLPPEFKIKLMGYAKDQMIECMEEERDNLEEALDKIEAYGERFEWYVGRSVFIYSH
jgi:hypothetical protein